MRSPLLRRPPPPAVDRHEPVADEGRPSLTALGVASLRAAHLLLDDPPPILNDTIALPLLGPDAAERIWEHQHRFRTPGSLGLRSHVLLRSRYAEDCLADAVARGMRQAVMLGAGMDTSAYRQPPGLVPVSIFEVDLSATQAAKRRRLADAGIEIPANVGYIPADLTDPSLIARLTDGGVDPTQRTFLTLLGVTVYLPPDAVGRLHRTLGQFAAGSEVVMTFSQPPTPDRPDYLAEAAAAAGEPWLTRTHPDDLVRDLHEAGFGTVEILDPADAERRYFRGRRDGLRTPTRASIARAVVGTIGQNGASALMPPSGMRA